MYRIFLLFVLVPALSQAAAPANGPSTGNPFLLASAKDEGLNDPEPPPPALAVKLEGPPGGQVASGGFAVIVTVPKGADVRVVWDNKSPPNAMPPLELDLRDGTGRYALAYFNPSVGVYRFQLKVQKSVDKSEGFDPFAEASLEVVYGSGPGPTPPGPGPLPTPFVPSAAVQQAMGPLRAAMAKADPTKLSVWRAAWVDYLDAVKQNPPVNVVGFKVSMNEFGNSVAMKEGFSAGTFTGFNAAIQAGFIEVFGNTDKPLNAAQAADFVTGVVWACTQ